MGDHNAERANENASAGTIERGGHTERRVVLIHRAPPRRILAPLRYRAFKTQPDRTIWEGCWAPVNRLLEDGWRMTRVTVDWGSALPMTTAWRERTIRELCGCYDGCEVGETVGDTGRGETRVELSRE
jgi:hypothetical protein